MNFYQELNKIANLLEDKIHSRIKAGEIRTLYEPVHRVLLMRITQLPFDPEKINYKEPVRNSMTCFN